MEEEALTEIIIGCAMKVHRTLGPGFLESVYEHAFAHEMHKAGLHTECQTPIQVCYDGIVVGDFIADMQVEKRVLVENKAVQSLSTAHEVQLVNYLTATGIEIGLLINFGASSLQFKRKHRRYQVLTGFTGLGEQGVYEDRGNARLCVQEIRNNPVNSVNPV